MKTSLQQQQQSPLRPLRLSSHLSLSISLRDNLHVVCRFIRANYLRVTSFSACVIFTSFVSELNYLRCHVIRRSHTTVTSKSPALELLTMAPMAWSKDTVGR
jgi:hypothetical protein